MASDVLDALRERGFVQEVSDEPGLKEAFASGPVTFYWGTDPTASSLTAGHLVSLMLLRHLQDAGHRPIVVVGGGTGLIGDPTGKTEMRQMLSETDIEANLAGQRNQVARYLDFSDGKALMLNNADWLRHLGYLEFLRDVGRHFSVNQLLQHSTYRERLDTGLNFIELNYALLQAYDFLHLFREHGCTLQVGGNDQWFNILSGVDLIRRVAGGQANALVTPLLTTSTGEKMGKTAGNAVWLDPERTSPYDFYQYWINIPDPDVERFLSFFTFLPMDEVRRLGQLEGAESRAAKEVLAFEATKLTHGEEAATDAREASWALFGGRRESPGSFLLGLSHEGAPLTTVTILPEPGLEFTELLVKTGLASSKRAARDLIRQGGAYVSDRRIGSVTSAIRWASDRDGLLLVEHLGAQAGDLLGDRSPAGGVVLLLRAGKKHYHRVVVEEEPKHAS